MAKRYRIETARMQGMTAPEAQESEPSALQRAVCLQRLNGILRARRSKTATEAKHRTDESLVASHKQYQTFDKHALHVGPLAASVVIGSLQRRLSK